MAQPLISIIIPVGPAHAAHAAVALASCRWQTVPDWEAILVNDSGQPLPVRASDQVRVLDAPPPRPGANRASVARNTGLDVARGVFTVYLDADDYLLPTGLATLLTGHVRHDAAYSYGWHYGLNQVGHWGRFRAPDYDRAALARFNLHPITALVPTDCLRDVGGCDEGTPGLEDWTVWLRLGMAGHCGQQVYGPTFVYRRDEGTNHVTDVAGGVALMDAVRGRYTNAAGEIDWMGCGCSGGAATARQAAVAYVSAGGATLMPQQDDGTIVLEFTGTGQGGQWFRTPSGRQYRAGRGPAVRYLSTGNGLDPADVPYLLGLGVFARVPPPAAFVPPPEPEGVTAAGTEAESAAPKRSSSRKGRTE